MRAAVRLCLPLSRFHGLQNQCKSYLAAKFQQGTSKTFSRAQRINKTWCMTFGKGLQGTEIQETCRLGPFRHVRSAPVSGSPSLEEFWSACYTDKSLRSNWGKEKVRGGICRSVAHLATVGFSWGGDGQHPSLPMTRVDP